MKTIGEFIRAMREERKLSAKELAKSAGISDGHVIYIEKGQRKPTFDILMKIVHALGADVNTFLQETGYLPVNAQSAARSRQKSIPVISWVAAGTFVEAQDTFQPGHADEWVEADVQGPHIFALRVKGDSMEPEFIDEEIIIVNPNIEAKPGDFVIVKNDENEATFKQLKKYGDTVVLHPLNPKYPDIELKPNSRYRIVGKVVKKEKKY